MASTVVAKYQTIVDDLRREIDSGDLAAGDYLPSQSQLIERYGVATGTVRQALMVLSSEGWVRPEKGRGVFVQPRALRQGVSADAPPTNVGFAIVGDFSEYEPELQMVLHGAMAQLQETPEANWHLSYRIFPRDNQLMLRLSAFLQDIAALIITRDVTPEVAQAVAASGVRTVFLDYRPLEAAEHEGFHVVCCEAEHSGHMAAHLLAIAGHRQLVVFAPFAKDNEYAMSTFAGVQRAAREYALPEPRIDFAATRAEEEDLVRRLAVDAGATGIIALNDIPACRLIHDLRQRGVRVPEDKSVLSIGGLSREQLSEPGLARVNRHYHRLGCEAARAATGVRAQIVHRSYSGSFEAGTTLARREPGE